MSGESDFAETVRRRIQEVDEAVPGSIGAQMDYQVLSWDGDAQALTMTCRTFPWMRNFAGTLHGGMCATILDQAMGFVSYCLKREEGTAPTVELNVDYHRPITPGQSVTVRVYVVSVTRSLIRLRAEAWQGSAPAKLCLSGAGIYFQKPAAKA